MGSLTQKLEENGPFADAKIGVVFTVKKITQIVKRVLPYEKVKDICKINVDEVTDTPNYLITLEPGPQNYVILKLAGQMFGARRIYNEVASLLLLERNLPMLPVPRVLGWCHDDTGDRRIHRVKRLPVWVRLESSPHPEFNDASANRGWLLLTKKPGRTLCWKDVEGEHGERIMKEIAKLTKVMSTICLAPANSFYGNLVICSDLGQVDFKVLGVMEHVALQKMILRSANDYWCERLQDRLNTVNRSVTLEQCIAELPKVLQDFMKNDLAGLLSLLPDTGPPTFSQAALHPASFTIAGSPPKVTSIRDFEFAGFFPPEVFFANTESMSNVGLGFWPPAAYEIYLKELERLGKKTPLTGIPKQTWEISRVMMEVIDLLAPSSELDGDGVIQRRERGQNTDDAIRAMNCIAWLRQILSRASGRDIHYPGLC